MWNCWWSCSNNIFMQFMNEFLARYEDSWKLLDKWKPYSPCQSVDLEIMMTLGWINLHISFMIVDVGVIQYLGFSVEFYRTYSLIQFVLYFMPCLLFSLEFYGCIALQRRVYGDFMPYLSLYSFISV